jgi:hypothetical protein
VVPSGQVMVYKFNESAIAYTQFGSVINGKQNRELFGSSVSISANGSTFVVGALYVDPGFSSITYLGVACVFKLMKLLTSIHNLFFFGVSVSLSMSSSLLVFFIAYARVTKQ